MLCASTSLSCGHVYRKNKEIYWPQIVAVLSVCLCSISAGLSLGWASPYIPELLRPDNPNNFTSNQVSYIAIVSPLGYLVGSPLSGYLANEIGRKNALLTIAIPQVIAWIILGLSDSVVMFCIGRIIAGIADVSTFMLIPMYIGEISHPKIRGILTTCLSLSIGTGTVLINIIGTYANVSLGSFICLTVPLLFVLTFMWMPESPYYYIMKGRTEKAREVLRSLRRRRDVSIELTQLNIDVRRQLSESGAFRDIFQIPSNLLALVIAISVRFFQHYAGIAAFLTYGRKLFQDAGSSISPSTATIITSLFSIVMLSVGSYLIDKYGRRPMMMISSLSSAVILAIMSIYYYLEQFEGMEVLWMPFVTMMAYLMTFCIGMGVTPNVLMGEIFSVSVKSKSLFIINIISGITMSTSTKIYQVLSDEYGFYCPCIVFCCNCIVAFAFTYLCIPETKSKTLEEIQTVMKRSSKRVFCKKTLSRSDIYSSSASTISTIASEFDTCNSKSDTRISDLESVLIASFSEKQSLTDSGKLFMKNYNSIMQPDNSEKRY